MQTKILLDEEQMPKKWYNVQADLKSPLDPPLHPKTQKPIGPEDLAAIFPMESDTTGSDHRSSYRHSGRGAGCPATLEAESPVSCSSA